MPHPPPRPAVVPLFGPRPSAGDFFLGMGLPFRAFGLILRSPRLLALSALCAAVTLVSRWCSPGCCGAAPRSLVGWAWPQPTAWYALLAWELVRLLTFVLLLIVGANTVPLLLLTPCRIRSRSPRSCAATSRRPLPAGPLRAGGGVGLGYTLARVALLLLGLALLLPLHLVPGWAAWPSPCSPASGA